MVMYYVPKMSVAAGEMARAKGVRREDSEGGWKALQ